MYDVNAPESHAAIGKKWLPMIRNVRTRDGSRMVSTLLIAFFNFQRMITIFI